MGEAGQSLPEEQIPQIVDDSDVRGNEIQGQDAFVHSCIDGVLNVDDIADVIVSSRGEVLDSIQRLIELGLVEWRETKISSVPPEAKVVDEVELSEELQTRIQETFHRADKLNHYELLGVAVDADRVEIKKARGLPSIAHADARLQRASPAG